MHQKRIFVIVRCRVCGSVRQDSNLKRTFFKQ